MGTYTPLALLCIANKPEKKLKHVILIAVLSWTAFGQNATKMGPIAPTDVITKATPAVDVRSYGAKGNDSTDDTAAINSANTTANSSNACLLFPPLIFRTTAKVTITAPCVKADGAVLHVDSAYNGIAVEVTNTFSSTLGCDLGLPGVRKSPRLWSSGTPASDAGISILDANACLIKVPLVAGFTDGLLLAPSGFGVGRNNIFLGQLNNNMRGIKFAPTTSNGFVNQNIFYGGYWAADFTLGWAVPGTRNILIAASTDQVTSNIFVGPDLEGQVAEYMAEIWGAYNRIVMPELENPASRTVTDATTTSGSPTITLSAGDVSAGKGFNANADTGQTVTSSLFPGGTTILSVGSTTLATASANATGNATANGTVTISSAPRIAFRNSGGNTAIQNIFDGGFPNTSLVVTKDAGVISNAIISSGKNSARWSLLDAGDPGVGRGATTPFNSNSPGYGIGSPQWMVHLDNTAGDTGTEGGIGACGPNPTTGVCGKLFVDDANSVWGFRTNGNVTSYIFAIANGATEFYRFNPAGNGTATVGSSAGTVNVGIGSTSTTNIPGTIVGSSNTSQLGRLRFNKATTQTSGNIALSAGWGNTASISSVNGNDQGLQLVISSSGTGQAASPAVTVTFADGTWTNGPTCIAGDSSGSSVILTGVFVSAVNATTLVVGFAGFTPVAGSTYGLNIICNGR